MEPKYVTNLSGSDSALTSPSATTGHRSPQELLSLSETSPAYAIIRGSAECHNLIQVFLSQCGPSQWATLGPRSWILLLGGPTTKVDALEMSSMAVAASAVGQMSQNIALTKSSLTYYTRGLHQLQKALYNPDLMKEDETLAACMALSLYEAIECPDSGTEGYFGHCKGILALIESRGAQAHSSGAGHQLFRGARIPAILHALQAYTSTILVDPAWIEQPWTIMPKTFLDRVTDCLAKAPSILERLPLLHHLNPNQQLELVHELAHECWQLEERLSRIYDEMLCSTPGPLYWSIPSQKHIPIDPSIVLGFESVYQFADFQCASTLVLLWATRTMLWSGLSNFYRLANALSTFGVSTTDYNTKGGLSSLPPLGYCEDILSMAHHVCRSVEYFLRDDLFLSGPLSVAPALGIVIDALKNQPFNLVEVLWLQGALDATRKRGIQALKYAKPK
ncbi:C6 zinc finger domain-containing protein [Penicillium nucicola]|uniref:C6 zinc finger domain-containing protein n=1 Tax=Penicillium nucicola TaxID=1850975 RepID=UPI002544FFD8|nr:C6 zinc finger domain-containing protein [Penicillium nucicola]KAJ5762456.1 C6 zinc finger domain-containing protein [Penicillium nucicola]